jgi:2-methylisocitrate lyase-like PEP mutase family enzyme
MVGKVRAAVAARDELDPAFVIAARSDAIGAAGETYDTALERAVAYARDGHADLVWMNGLSSPEQVARACAAIPAPVMTIWAGGKPVPSAAEFAALGLRIVLYPTLLATIGLEATWHVLNDFHRRGAPALDDFNASFGEAPWGRVDRGALIEAARVGELEAAFVSKPKS